MAMPLGPRQRRWTRALLSGKYRQGRSNLTSVYVDENGKIDNKMHCCLGVFCHMNPKIFGKVRENYSDGMDLVYTYKKASKTISQQLDEEAYKELGLFDGEGNPNDDITSNESEKVRAYLEDTYNLPYPDTVPSLVDLNDTHGASFEQIAKILRKFPEVYFKEYV